MNIIFIFLSLKVVIYTIAFCYVNVTECAKIQNPPSIHDDPRKCGTSRMHTARIVNGQNAVPNGYPWTTLILLNRQMHCSGSLINNRFVLTAGHCLNPGVVQVRALSLVFGVHDRASQTEQQRDEVPIKWAKIHEQYMLLSNDESANDIGIIKTKRDVIFTIFIRPICLPDPETNYDSKEVVVAGWGRLLEDGPISRYLQVANLTVLPNAQCKKRKDGTNLTPQMLCAGGIDKLRLQDACQGDSGGPLMILRCNDVMELVGVVSWGIGCANPNMPGVYTRITSYLPWIFANMRHYNREYMEKDTC